MAVGFAYWRMYSLSFELLFRAASQSNRWYIDLASKRVEYLNTESQICYL